MNPKVSIIIPVYNGSNYLKDAIDSALAQTYKNIEIIVVNDGSNDDGATEIIANSYGNKIRYFKKENGGVATALNFGIKEMKGDYFSWLSHDDMYEKNKIINQVSFLNSLDSPDIIVACNTKILYGNGLIREEYIDKKLFKYFDVFLAIAGDVGVNGCSLLIPKKCLIKTGGFNSNLPVTQDYDLWFRLSRNYNFALLEENLIISRRHLSQDSVTKQQVCYDAGDKLHYDFLNQISEDRLWECIDKNGLDKFWEKYILYRNSGYIKTSSMILRIITGFYKLHDKKGLPEIIKNELGDIVKLSCSINKSKKRIVFFNNVWCKGGIARVIMDVFNLLGDKYDFFLVTTDIDEYGEGYLLPENISYIRINNQNQNSKIMNILTYFDIDVFVGNPNFYESFIDIYKLIKGSNTKTVAYNHGHYFLPYMYAHLYPTAIKIKKAYSFADVAIWLSQVSCNLYNIGNSNGSYIPNAVNIITDFELKKMRKKLLAVGRFNDDIKRIDRIFIIFKEVLKLDAEFSLDVIGVCPMDFVLKTQGGKTIGEFLNSLEIPIDKIKFWGDRDDVTTFYNNANVLIMPSDCEGFGMVLVEALSSGVPCVCSDYLGIEEIIQNEYNGWYSSDDKFLANKIIGICHDRKKYNIMSKNSRDSINKYSLNIFSNNWTTLIESLTSRNDVNDHKFNTPIHALSVGDYEKITLEYETRLNSVAFNYINKQLSETDTTANAVIYKSRIVDWTERFRISLKREGVFNTIEKILNKIYRKVMKINNQ